MKNINEIESQLWNYIDGFSDTGEKAAIEKLMIENKEWSEKYKELLQLHQIINSIELEQPSMRFTKNVMDEIEKYSVQIAAKKFINHNIIYSIGAFFIITIVTLLSYGFSQTETNNTKTLDIEKEISGVDFNVLFSNNYIHIFIGINIILALMLFDKYLNFKKAKWLH